jgi:hypothetical protein
VPDAAEAAKRWAEGASADGLADLQGLERVHDQLRGVLAILEAERSRERGGWSVRRRVLPVAEDADVGGVVGADVGVREKPRSR